MNRQFVSLRVALAVWLCVALNACAVGPKGTDPPAAAGQAVGATSATTPPSAAPAASMVAGATRPIANKPPPGFKARKRDGELVYCRTVQATGSLFPEEQCWPPEKVWAALEKQRESSQRLLKQQRGCRGTDCAAGTPTGP